MSRSSVTSSAFSSLKIRDYRVLWWAGTLSFMSVQMQFLLRSLLAWDLTESERALGEVYLFFGLTMLVATPLGGVAADRLPKRTVLLLGQLVTAVSASGLGLAVITGREQFWMLLAAGMAQGASFGFFGPTRAAYTRDLVGVDQLGNAISLSMLSMNGTKIFAPSVAGAMVGVSFIGMGYTYMVAAVFAVLSLLMIARLPKAPKADPALKALHTPSTNPFADIIDGVRYVAASRPLRRLVLSSSVVIMFGFNYVAFIPSLIEGVFELGEGSVGLFSSAGAIGAVLAFLPIAARADTPKAHGMMVWSGFGFAGGVVLLSFAPNLAVAMLVALVIGAMTNAYQSLTNTLGMVMSDKEHQGRVQSLMQLSFAGFGMAAAPLGLLAEVIGIRAALAFMGAIAMVSMAVYAILERNEPIVIPRPDGGTMASAVANGHSQPDTVPGPAMAMGASAQTASAAVAADASDSVSSSIRR